MRPTYGPVWRQFREWYFNHPYTIKRCVWCLARPRPVTVLQLNHLTYRMPDPDWPAWWQVVPLCDRCHEWETWLTRRLFGEGWHRNTPYAHYYVTFGVIVAVWVATTITLDLMVGMVV
jgi:hypothetical protein